MTAVPNPADDTFTDGELRTMLTSVITLIREEAPSLPELERIEAAIRNRKS